MLGEGEEDVHVYMLAPTKHRCVNNTPAVHTWLPRAHKAGLLGWCVLGVKATCQVWVLLGFSQCDRHQGVRCM